MSFVRDQQNVRSQGVYYNAGLRSYLVKVYNYMAIALGITGIVAFFVASSQAVMSAVYGTPLQWLVVFLPVILVSVMSYKLHSLSFQSTIALFISFSALVGVSLSYIFVVYTAESIARVFFITAAMFGSMALYGNNTKHDLTKLGSFLMMGVIGLIIASLTNLFLGSHPLQFAISLITVVIFTLMTAYDAQRIKDLYYQFNDGSEIATNKLAIMEATSLYFNFINIFLSLLRLFGDRK
ncbi:Bax inhibitor-1/YccA family protein [Candidatus Mesenet endosymbiont of Agriotes lineatus]|uniref:Bax inhibitor-1/YccA family protein n=1 Tax=Candidatus Mesenet endosymbiont of Agriotes lineatus TaxID=3077948 RepID=UPI0030CCCE9B